MSLLGEIEAAVRRNGPQCSVATISATLSSSDKADLEAAIVSPQIPASAIGRALRARDLRINDEALTRHRRGECSCPTS